MIKQSLFFVCCILMLQAPLLEGMRKRREDSSKKYRQSGPGPSQKRNKRNKPNDDFDSFKPKKMIPHEISDEKLEDPENSPPRSFAGNQSSLKKCRTEHDILTDLLSPEELRVLNDESFDEDLDEGTPEILDDGKHQ